MCDEWVQQRMGELPSALPAVVMQKEQVDVLEVPAHRVLYVSGVGSELGDDLGIERMHIPSGPPSCRDSWHYTPAKRSLFGQT